MAKLERRAWLMALWCLSFVLVYGAGFGVVYITNIGPLLAKPETYGLAFMNTVLLAFMTNIFSEAGVLEDPRQKAGTLFLGFLFFFGAYYNSVNGVSEGRDKTAGENATKIETIGNWDTQIEEWHKLDLKIPEHPPATEEQYAAKLKARDDANALRDAQCKESFIKLAADRARALQTCESLKTKAETAQKEFDPVSTHWGYEKSHRDYIAKIAEARRKKKEEGPKPKYEDAAAGRLAPYLSRFGVTEAGLRDFMPLFYAALADLIFIFGSNITMRRINRAFAEAFGPGWWKRKEPVAVASIPAMVPPSVGPSAAGTIAERSPTVAPTLVETVAPIPATVSETIAPAPHETVATTKAAKPPRRETVAEWKNVAVASIPAMVPPSVGPSAAGTIAERSPTVAPTLVETVAPIPATVSETIAPAPHETVATTQVVKPPRRETVAEWKTHRTHYRAGTETPAGTLYDWYASYCRERGETPVSQTLFGREMVRLGVKKNGDRSRPKYLDIALKTPLRVVI